LKATIELSSGQEADLRRLARDSGETDLGCLIERAINEFLERQASPDGARMIEPIEASRVEALLSLSGALEDEDDDLAGRVAQLRELPWRS